VLDSWLSSGLVVVISVVGMSSSVVSLVSGHSGIFDPEEGKDELAPADIISILVMGARVSYSCFLSLTHTTHTTHKKENFASS
jgi:hypothetical protein